MLGSQGGEVPAHWRIRPEIVHLRQNGQSRSRRPLRRGPAETQIPLHFVRRTAPPGEEQTWGVPIVPEIKYLRANGRAAWTAARLARVEPAPADVR